MRKKYCQSYPQKTIIYFVDKFYIFVVFHNFKMWESLENNFFVENFLKLSTFLICFSQLFLKIKSILSKLFDFVHIINI